MKLLNWENHPIPAKTPHLQWIEIETALNTAGQREISILGKWEDHDVPVEMMHCYFDDMVELTHAVRKLASHYYTRELIHHWRTMWAILRGKDTPFRLNEHEHVTGARQIRGVYENVKQRIATRVRSWLWKE
jgi:hypothetical protein